MKNQPINYPQIVLSRAAGFCFGLEKKLLIVCAGVAKDVVAENVAFLGLQVAVDLLDATGLSADHPPFEVNDAYGAVFTASDAVHPMPMLRGLCRLYQAAGVPVLALSGWPLPTDSGQFKRQVDLGGNVTVPGMFDLAARFCGGAPGDYFEFGTFLGYTLQCAFHAFNSRGLANNRRFIAFDSFAGIIGSKTGEAWVDGSYAASVESLKFANLIAEVPSSKVVLVEGAYQHTLRDAGLADTRATIGETQAAVIHIDCDVEEPAKLALDFMTPYIRQGTLLLFDEFDVNRADNAKGERAALRAWLKENPEFEVEPYRCYHVHARSFILHKNS